MSDDNAVSEIIAALVWDVPTLRAGSTSARDFALALPGELTRWWEPKRYGTDALGRAAQAVASERGHEREKAAELYGELSRDDDPWARLLGLMLRAWSSTEEGADAISRARAAMHDVDPAQRFERGCSRSWRPMRSTSRRLNSGANCWLRRSRRRRLGPSFGPRLWWRA